MLKQSLEIKARGCCMHVFLVYSLIATPKVCMASTLIFSDSSISIWLRSCRCAKTAILGCGHFQAFRPGFSIWHICHVVCHGHFTLKQLRLSVLNEMHTNSYTGPRLLVNSRVNSFVLQCLETLVKHEPRAYEITSQSTIAFINSSDDILLLFVGF